jgi:hypothetical protein
LDIFPHVLFIDAVYPLVSILAHNFAEDFQASDFYCKLQYPASSKWLKNSSSKTKTFIAVWTKILTPDLTGVLREEPPCEAL